MYRDLVERKAEYLNKLELTPFPGLDPDMTGRHAVPWEIGGSALEKEEQGEKDCEKKERKKE